MAKRTEVMQVIDDANNVQIYRRRDRLAKYVSPGGFIAFLGSYFMAVSVENHHIDRTVSDMAWGASWLCLGIAASGIALGAVNERHLARAEEHKENLPHLIDQRIGRITLGIQRDADEAQQEAKELLRIQWAFTELMPVALRPLED